MLRAKTTTQCRSRDEIGGAKASETNSFNDVQDAWMCEFEICQDLRFELGSLASRGRRPIAFDPEGSSLDRCLPVNNLG